MKNPIIKYQQYVSNCDVNGLYEENKNKINGFKKGNINKNKSLFPIIFSFIKWNKRICHGIQ